MLLLSDIFKKSSSNGFFGATFDSGKLNLILFKDGYPLCWAQEHLTRGVVLDGRPVDKDQFTQALNVCIERCLDERPESLPREIFFGVGGGNIIGSLTSARQKHSLGEKVAKNFLSNIYKELEQSSLNSALEEVYQTTGNDELELENVLNDTTSVKLDGVTTYNPIGENGEVLEVEVFNAYCAPSYIDVLERVARGVKLRLEGVFPLQYLLSKKLRAKLGDGYDATLLNVHSDFTDVSVVFGGRLVKNKPLPLGSLDLEKDLDFWMDGLELVLTSFSGVKTFANGVYVCGVGLERTDFWEMLEWREWEEKIPFKTRPVFTKLDASYVGLPQDYKDSLLICGLLSICKELV